MKIAVISDVHSNLTALEAVIKDIESQNIKSIACLGDILGYGPFPVESFEIVKDFCQIILKGNHDEACINDMIPFEFTRYAAEGIRFSKDKINDSIKEYMSKLPFTHLIEPLDTILCHGTYREPEKWNYILNKQDAKHEIRHIPHRICLVGHTHIPMVYGSRGYLMDTLPDIIELDPKQKYIINVGSIGQPRDGDCRACYCILDYESIGKVVINFRRIFYNIGLTAKAMKDAEISDYLSDRLYKGK